MNGSLRELESIYETAPVGLCVLDRELRFVRINRHLAELNGASVEAHIGRTVREMLPAVAALVEPLFRRVLETGEPLIGFELRGETPAAPGVPRTWLENWHPLRDASGTVIGINVVAEEITERKRAEDSRRDADRRNAAFLAVLAHELRNPLAPVRNGVQLLSKRDLDPADRVRVLQMMERQTLQMVRLVDDLLDVSRIERGKLLLRREAVELAPIVANGIEASQTLIDSFAHELIVRLPSEPLVLWADPARIAQVIANLLNNAARFTPSGGRIVLTAGAHDGEAVISITDSGIGIRAAELARLFDLFAQGRAFSDTPNAGLGIGLALVRSLVEQHEGSVTAQSEGAGRGSTFTVRLPLAARRSAPQPVPAAQAAAR